MKGHRLLIILLSIFLFACITFVLACNIIIVHTTNHVCYSNIDQLPHSQYGILFGTGRSANPSPYYDARINATVTLLQAGKVDTIVVSGENLHADYNEVDSMALDIQKVVPTANIYLDYDGVDTYHTLNNFAQQFGNDKNIILISQHFHNQRSVYYAQRMFRGKVLAFDATDTNKFFWRVRNVIRELGARTKAVIYQPSVITIVSFEVGDLRTNDVRTMDEGFRSQFVSAFWLLILKNSNVFPKNRKKPFVFRDHIRTT